jgi:23S rRNA pseudouridine2605 synthase
MAEPVRIHKALADAGVASRRAAEALVEQRRVTVNGEIAVVGQRVDPQADVLAVDGRAVGERPAPVYLVLAKPAGVTATVSDRHAERTVLDLVPPALRRDAKRLYPVGRLDRDSEGLLLLTNDGDWAQLMLHPSHAVEREYAVALTQPLTGFQIDRLKAGVVLEEGTATIDDLRRATTAEVRTVSELIGAGPDRLTWYRAVLHQGWKRQLRRMFGDVGARVERLVRVRFGTLRLQRMSLGDVRELTPRERRQLESLVGREARP